MKKLADFYENPIVTRSKNMLTEAFFDLLMKNPNRRIKVSELCNKAGVARPTFYSHYHTIEEIPKAFFCKWLNELNMWVTQVAQEKQTSVYDPKKRKNFYELLFEYWCSKVEIVKNLQTAGYEKVIIECFIRAHELAMKNLVGRIFELPMELQNFLQSKGAIVAYELYKYWISTDMKLSVDQLVEINSHLNTKEEIIEFRRISMGLPDNNAD